MPSPTIENLRSFSDGEGNFEFNFSHLPKNYYPQLFSVLLKFPQDEISSLTFSCDNIKHSSSGNYTGLDVLLTNFLKGFLPTQHSLEKISFKKIRFSPELYNILGSAVSKSPYVSIVNFEDIPIGDENLSFFFQTLDPNLIQDLYFINCSITNKVRDLLIDLFKRRTQCIQGLGLSTLIVQGPEFTIQDEINQIIDDAHANDKNEEEDESDAATTKPPPTQEDETQTQDKQSLELTLSSTIPNDSMEEEIFEEEEEIQEENFEEENEQTNEAQREAIIEENKKLKALIKILREMPNPINFGEKGQQVIAIGPGSKRFEQHLFALAKAAKV